MLKISQFKSSSRVFTSVITKKKYLIPNENFKKKNFRRKVLEGGLKKTLK